MSKLSGPYIPKHTLTTSILCRSMPCMFSIHALHMTIAYVADCIVALWPCAGLVRFEELTFFMPHPLRMSIQSHPKNKAEHMLGI